MEVVVDGIPYKVDKNQLPLRYQKVVKSGVVLFFNTGELSITSTRESLDYRGDTVAKITEKVGDISDYMEGKALDAISSSGLWDAQKLILSIKPFLNESDTSIPDSFFGKSESIPKSCKLTKLYKSYGDIRSSETSYLDYSSEFSILLSRTKNINHGRVDTYLEETKALYAFVLKIPSSVNHKHVRLDFTGNDGLIRFINWIDEAYPNIRIREVLDPRYDLQSWPISDNYKKEKTYVKKKFTKSALKVVNGKWAGVEVSELEKMKSSRNVYYIFEKDIKTLKGKRIGISDQCLMSNPIFIALDEDQKDSVPTNWKPYWKTIAKRASDKLAARTSELKALTKTSPKELFRQCDGDNQFDILKKYYYMFPKNFRELVCNLSDDYKEVRAYSNNFSVLRVVNISGPLSIKVILSYRGPGSIYDKKALKSFITGLRKSLIERKDTQIRSLKNLIEASKKNSILR
jgi:hypothetical protein